MIVLSETTAFDWIAKGRDLPPARGAGSPEWTGNVVAQCIPRVFPAYCKLFHPIHEDASIRSRDLTWDEEKRVNPGPSETEPGEKALAAIVKRQLTGLAFGRSGGKRGDPCTVAHS